MIECNNNKYCKLFIVLVDKEIQCFKKDDDWWDYIIFGHYYNIKHKKNEREKESLIKSPQIIKEVNNQ